MPDPIQTQTPPTPGQVLAGTPPPPPDAANMPLASSPAQPQQPPAPTPQQMVAARHHDIGKAASFLFGAQVDPQSGEPVREKPGHLFRSLLAGALLGGAMGSEGKASGGSVGGFLSGVARGGNAVEQQNYQRQQQAQENARKQAQLTLEQQRTRPSITNKNSTSAQPSLRLFGRGSPTRSRRAFRTFTGLAF